MFKSIVSNKFPTDTNDTGTTITVAINNETSGPGILLLDQSDVMITNSLFIRNSVDSGRIIYSKRSSHISAFNTAFVKNHAAIYCDSNNMPSQCMSGIILYVDTTSTVTISDSKFEHNRKGT